MKKVITEIQNFNAKWQRIVKIIWRSRS